MSDSPEPPPEEARNWLELPEDVMVAIFNKVGIVDVLAYVRTVCTTWRRICQDPIMWRVVDLTDLFSEVMDEFDYDPEKMTKCIVDLSCGQLVDLSMKEFFTKDLLEYVADRLSQLRRLSLLWSKGCEMRCSTLKKLPLLEELHLHYTTISKASIETAGRFCPNLKSFKLSMYRLKNPFKPQTGCDGIALAIAKNMPHLRKLHLFGNAMTDTGLRAILDSCLSLESLDLRKCYFLDLSGDLKERCVKQIKDLKLPRDPTENMDYDYYNYESSPDSEDGESYGWGDILSAGFDDEDSFSDGFYYSDEYDLDDYEDYSLLFDDYTELLDFL